MTIKIALDDGHGLKPQPTPGKRSPDGSLLENEFNRRVVELLDKHLRRNKFETVLVAPGDEDVPLEKRVQTANNSKADLYVSIHANSSAANGWDTANGIEIFVVKLGYNAEKAAKAVLKHLVKGTPQKNRGIKEANFYVLRKTNMPAILIECGFMNNKEELKLLKSETFRQECAEEIAKGICEFFKVTFVRESPQQSKYIWKVQIGAFSIEENAKKLAKELNSKGYDTWIVKNKI